MRPGLLSADQDVDIDALADADPTLVADLGLGRITAAMGAGDKTIELVAGRLLVAPVPLEAIAHRQAVVRDAIACPAMTRELYAVAVDAIEAERRIWGAAMRNAELMLDRAANVLGRFLEAFRALRRIEAAYAGDLASPGFTAFFGMVATLLDDAWLADVEGHLARLRTRTLDASAHLGAGNRGTGYVLHRAPTAIRTWRDRIGLEGRRSTITVSLRDQNAMHAMSDLRAMAVASTAGVVRDAADLVLAFFLQARTELAFLVGCVNLQEALAAAGGTVTFPEVVRDRVGDDEVAPAFRATALYEPGLRLAIDGPVVANDVDVDGRRLVVITGANGGGKSTLLRAVGLAELMAGAGMFVAAERLRMDRHASVMTHFTREEDAAFRGGRLDEELGRLRALVDGTSSSTLVLLNESLSTTNEREGAVIAGEVVRALVDSGVQVWFVTHNHQLASDLYGVEPRATFLRAERGDAERPFHLVVGAPLPTSHGMDLYRRIIGAG